MQSRAVNCLPDRLEIYADPLRSVSDASACWLLLRSTEVGRLAGIRGGDGGAFSTVRLDLAGTGGSVGFRELHR